MNKSFFTLVLILLPVFGCIAQQIEVEKVFGGTKYSLNGELLTLKEMSGIVKENPEAYELVKKARRKTTISYVVGGIGGALMGYGLGQSFGEGDANWPLIGVGASVIVLGIPLINKAGENAREAVELYNSSLEQGGANNFRPSYKIIGNRNGIGLALAF